MTRTHRAPAADSFAGPIRDRWDGVFSAGMVTESARLRFSYRQRKGVTPPYHQIAQPERLSDFRRSSRDLARSPCCRAAARESRTCR